METSCKKMENVKNIFEVLIESTYNELKKNDDNIITQIKMALSLGSKKNDDNKITEKKNDIVYRVNKK